MENFIYEKKKRLEVLKKIITTQKELDNALDYAGIEKSECEELGYEFDDYLDALACELKDWQVEELYFDKIITEVGNEV